jgi:lysozyme
MTRAQAIAAGLVLGSASLVAFLTKWEPSKTDPGLVYADPLAGGILTVCNGITKHVTNERLILGDRWPVEKCRREETIAQARVQDAVLACFDVAPPQGVLDAATEHAWNFGAGQTCSSLAMQAWNQGEWSLGCRRMAWSDGGRRVWSYGTDKDGNKVFIRGLANRRDDAVRLCEGRWAP